MRLLMFTMLTELSASSRVICYQFAPYFLAEGIRTHFCAPSSKLFYQLCNRDPENFLGRVLLAFLWRLYWYIWVPVRRLFFISLTPFYDVIFIERGMRQYCSRPWLEMLAYKWASIWGKKIIYCFDDPIYVDCPNYTRRLIEKADVFMTYADEIAEYALKYNPKVVMLEPSVDINRYPLKNLEESRGSDKLILGWVGNSMVGFRYLHQLCEPLLRLYKKYPNLVFRVVSGRDFQFQGEAVPVENVRWSLDYEASVTFDIGLAPHLQTDYDQGKRSFKILQYWAHGIPVVCSQTADDFLEDGRNCLIAKGPNDWFEKLSLLIDRPDLRLAIGARGRKLIETKFAINVQGPIFASILKNIVMNSSRVEYVRRNI